MWSFAARVALMVSVAAVGSAQEHFVLQSGRGLGMAMAFSPDGSILATGDAWGIALIDVASRRHRAYFGDARGRVKKLAFTPDGRFLVSGCEPFLGTGESAIQIWDARDPREVQTMEVEAGVVDLAFIGGGERLVSAHDDGSVSEWDWRRGERLGAKSYPTDEFLGGVALSANGRRVAVLSGFPYRSWWEYAEGRVYETMSDTQVGEFSPPTANLSPTLLLSHDGEWIAMDGRFEKILPKSEGPLEIPWDLVPLSIDADGIATVSRRVDGTRSLETWNLARGEALRSIPMASDWPSAAVVSPTAGLIAVRVDRGGTPRIAFYDLSNFAAIGEVTGPAVHPAGETSGSGPLEIAAFTPDGSALAVADALGTIRFWNTDNWTETRRLETACSNVTALRMSPVGGALAVHCGAGGELQLWDLASDRVIRSIGGYSDDFDFTADGKRLAWLERFGAVVQVHWVDVASGEDDQPLPVATAKLRFASGGEETNESIVGLLIESNYPMPGAMLRLGVWDAKTGRERWHVPEGGAFALSPDGNVVATASNLYDVGSGDKLRRYTERRGFVQSLAFSDDGRRLAAGWDPLRTANDRRSAIVLWDVESWTEIAELKGHDGSIGLVEFSPDGRQLVSVSHDLTVRVWSLDSLN